MECPECEEKMERVADWPEEWVVCPNCFHVENLEDSK